VFEKKRRQLYSFYNESGQGFEAFFTPDCSSLVVSVCTKKEFLSVQLRELEFDSSQSVNISNNESDTDQSNLNNLTTNTSDYWHSIAIVHTPAKGPFSYSQVSIYVDGVLKKETDLKLPTFSDQFTHIRIGAACFRPQTAIGSVYSVSNSLSAPFVNLKNVFGSFAYKSNAGATEKSLNVTSIPSGSQDTVFDPSTCLMGQMSSCFALHDTITEFQARLLYELGPNQFSLNWLDIVEFNDFKTKFLFHYDAKCCKDLTCFDLSSNINSYTGANITKLQQNNSSPNNNGKFSGFCLSCDNFTESLNSIGSIQVFFPLLNYLSSNQDYVDLVTNEWSNNAKHSSFNDGSLVAHEKGKNLPKKSSFDGESENVHLNSTLY